MIKDIAKLQKDYTELISSGKMTKRAMCELIIPFRDKYHLTDKQALMLARDEMSFAELGGLIQASMVEVE